MSHLDTALAWTLSRLVDLIAVVGWAEVKVWDGAVYTVAHIWPAMILIGLGALLLIVTASRKDNAS